MTTTPIGWPTAQRISEAPAVHEALEAFSHDSTEDNAVGLICAVLNASNSFAQGRAAGLEPQGQALPELPGRDEVHHYYWEHPIQDCTFYKYASHWSTGPKHAKPLFTADQMHAYARAYASQLALPAGPVPVGPVAVGKITGVDEYGPMIEWRVHWADLVGRLLYASPSPAVAQPENKHDWPEDWPHENGKYLSRCHQCHVFFTGHKRRVTCKVCASPAVAQPVADERDAGRYRKLRRWMGSNVPEGWQQVEQLGAVCAWMGWGEMDAMLDDMPECGVGLAAGASPAAPVKIYAKYLIERQDAVGVSWDILMGYSTLEQVHNALPYWRKDSKRPLRVVFEKRTIIDAARAALCQPADEGGKS